MNLTLQFFNKGKIKNKKSMKNFTPKKIKQTKRRGKTTWQWKQTYDTNRINRLFGTMRYTINKLPDHKNFGILTTKQ